MTCLQSGSPGLASVCVKVMYLSGSSVGYPGDENEMGDIYEDVSFVPCMIRRVGYRNDVRRDPTTYIPLRPLLEFLLRNLNAALRVVRRS
jgi:hypothetical protein